MACDHQDLNCNIQTTIWTTMIQLITITVFPFCSALAYFALCCSTFFETKFNKFTSTSRRTFFAKSSNFLVHSWCKQNLAGVHKTHFSLCIIYRPWRTCERIYSSKLSWAKPIHGIPYLMNLLPNIFFQGLTNTVSKTW